MIFSSEAQELITQWQAALEHQAAVVKEFAAFARTRNLDQGIAEGFLKRMEDAGNKVKHLEGQLQPFRLDT